MNILSLNYEYPPLGGGAGVVTKELNSQLAAKGMMITTVTSHYSGLKKYQKQNKHILIRLPVLRYHQGFSNTFEKMGYIFAGFLYAGLLVRKYNPDIVHAHFAIPSGIIAWYICKRFGIPYILTSHGGDVPEFTPAETGKYFRWLNWLFKEIWQTANLVTTMSQGVADLIKKHYEIEAYVIPNGININTYYPSKISKNGVVELLFAGRLNKQKNVHHLINSLQSVKMKNWRLKIAGDGPERKSIAQYIIETRMENKVKLLGWITHQEMKHLFSQADVLCLPSLNEGLPIVGLEALASGLAIVGTDTAGIRDIVQDGSNGYLVPLYNHTVYAQKIEHLCKNKKTLMEMKQKSRQLAHQFNWEWISERYAYLFQKVLTANA